MSARTFFMKSGRGLQTYLGQEIAKDQDNTGKGHLDPDGNPPRGGSINGRSAIRDKSTWNTPHEPACVVDSRHGAAECWVSHLRHVCGTSGGTDGNAKSQNEPTSHEASEVVARSLHNRSNHNDESSNAHSDATT